MAKLKAPLLSFGASGKLADTLVYFPWKGLAVVRSYVIPANPNSAGQQTQRGILTESVASWHALGLDDDDVTAWNRYAASRPTPQSGFNAFVKDFVDLRVSGVILAAAPRPSPPRSPTPSAPARGRSPRPTTSPAAPSTPASALRTQAAPPAVGAASTASSWRNTRPRGQARANFPPRPRRRPNKQPPDPFQPAELAAAKDFGALAREMSRTHPYVVLTATRLARHVPRTWRHLTTPAPLHNLIRWPTP